MRDIMHITAIAGFMCNKKDAQKCVCKAAVGFEPTTGEA